MRLDPVNAVSSFHYYMWNAWGEEECKITFGGAYNISGRNGTPLQANQYSEQQNDSMPNSRITTENCLSIVLWHSMMARPQERSHTMKMYMFVMLAVQEKLRFKLG